MTELLFPINGVEICAESFGNAADPAILLMMGAQSSMVYWETEMCERIASTGRFVIRYDNRDVGRSTTYELGNPGYTFEDLADDAIGVLDAYQVQKAHFVGMSMGGIIAQMIALRHSERMLSLTLISSSNFAPDLPAMDEKVMEKFATLGEIDWSNDQEVVDFSVAKWRILAGSKHPFNEDHMQALIWTDVKRSNSMVAANNHAMISGGETYLQRTKEINVPTLVIHGTEDPIIPVEHGHNLARSIPGANLVLLEGTGHELPIGDWDTIIEVVKEHTATSLLR
ncbi:alpha/beta fold hydrolase [Paenibacillus sp. N1-5-1-14]|uniref:alpha/beta fold hydrolase n=1 Tax=Paenibacillus radicibacter TaxID=2972488 RepID=UPI00215912C5|nr:alpha/beta fold hydrolase [Paenibacillus radicibacter]MCR8641321.1 alpha/beta fold hydrolase [Paenibacillus radicibacter]